MKNFQTLALLLSLQLALAPAAPAAVTEALEGASNAINTIGEVGGAVQQSQATMQGLVNQFALMQNQRGNMTTAQGQFDMVKQQLSVAMAEADQCIKKAQKDTSKYKKATILPADIMGKEASCSNYGNLIDSIKKTSDMMLSSQTKVACLRTLQDKINQIADAAKAPFGNLTQAASEVRTTYQNIIDGHQSIVDRLENDLNAKGGYKEQLANLKSLNMNLQNALNMGTGKAQGGGSSSGIGKQLRDLKRQRVNAANNWYYSLMTKTQTCFASTGTAQCGNAITSPVACVNAYVTAVPNGNAAERSFAQANAGTLGNIFRLNVAAIKENDKMAGIDVSQPEQFLQFTNGRFENMLKQVLANFSRQNFKGQTVNKTDLNSFVSTEYRKCYEQAVADFRADMQAEGPEYAAGVNALYEQESALANDIRNLIDQTQQGMNSFRTAFNKVYNRDLAQFTADCTASESPYESADCLRKLQVTLKGGIEGTRQTIRLDNGTTATYEPGPTVLTLQTMGQNAQGKPTLVNTQTSCVGFDECINVLDRYQTHNREQVEAQTKAQQAFIEQHNKTVDAAITGVSAVFSQVSQMVAQAVGALNQELAAAGVAASLSTTQIEGERLKPNETTGLYDVPTNMKSALAGYGTYSEMGDPTEALNGLTTRATDLNGKAAEAFTAKGKCTINQSDFDSIVNRLGECKIDDVCKGDRIGSVLQVLEPLLRRSQSAPATDTSTEIREEYQSCMDSARSSGGLSAAEAIAASQAKGFDMAAYNTAADQQKMEDQRNCGIRAVESLDALAGTSRTTMKQANGDIMSAIRNMASACPDDPATAVDHCKAAKSAAGKAKPPADEGPTNVDGAAASTGHSNPLSGTSAK